MKARPDNEEYLRERLQEILLDGNNLKITINHIITLIELRELKFTESLKRILNFRPEYEDCVVLVQKRAMQIIAQNTLKELNIPLE